MTAQSETGSGAAQPLLMGKVVLVTGASSGIGADAARLFAREGARVIVAARSERPLAGLVDELAGKGHEAAYVVGDVSIADDVTRFVSAAVERFGRLDGALNNAATMHFGRLDEVSEEDFDRDFAVNVNGVWLCLREELRVMRPAGSGSIVNVSSIGGLRGSPGMGAYQATKHAVIGLTRTAAHDAGPDGIRVNTVAPGPTVTPAMREMPGGMPEAFKPRIAAMPLRKPGTTYDVAEAAAWLLSDRASHISGVVLPVDGGFTA